MKMKVLEFQKKIDKTYKVGLKTKRDVNKLTTAIIDLKDAILKLVKLLQFMIMYLVLPMVVMIFVLALLFAGVKYQEIKSTVKDVLPIAVESKKSE